MPDTRPHPRLTLHLSGAFRATDATGSDVTGLSRRGQALLAVLSQHPDMRAERGHLADLLWSDRGEEQARASLRQELTTLRKALPDGVLETDRHCVRLDPTCVEAVIVPGATFLEGFDLASEGFEDWLRDTRAALTDTPQAPAPPSDVLFSRPAVLLFAFETLSEDDRDRMIAAGLADDLRTTLSYWRWFPVIGPEAIGWKTAKEADLRATAAEVDAAYAVTGTIRCLGNRVKITVGLTEAETGRSRWSGQFAGTLDDIFAFQEDVSRAIVAQLEPQISRVEAVRIARTRPSSVGPWQLLAQADEVDRRGGEGYGTPESNWEQVRLMERALELAPDFAPAHARIGCIQFRAGLLGWVEDRTAAFDTSLEHTSRALAIDPDNWEAHAYSGLVGIFGRQEYSSGRFHSQEAVRLNPSAALARHALGCALEWLGEPETALEHLHLIFRLNPNHKGRAAALGDITTCEMFIGHRDAALDAAERLLAIAPGYARGLQRCVVTFGYFDVTERAAHALDMLRREQPDFGEAYVRETYPYARPEHLEMILEGFRKAGAFGP
ncbi:hypothetical protein P1J78_13515 [Psychromarinibacter sp. C21-152]|uniref:TolB-like protein n=1 Tax=Psychromarinibacter sediminicola TaxID=3033385 RepID=A0AAE3NPF6_9RHOB|nr:hypothetical protein [Psychromarinibacter sediminicola]MDF0601758.1 hypothetical protein [Psychromarinibacter sediminicola]